MLPPHHVYLLTTSSYYLGFFSPLVISHIYGNIGTDALNFCAPKLSPPKYVIFSVQNLKVETGTLFFGQTAMVFTSFYLHDNSAIFYIINFFLRLQLQLFSKINSTFLFLRFCGLDCYNVWLT